MDRAWGTGLEGQRIADLGEGTYRNPVLAGDFPDPAVLKDGADYYLTTSSFDASPGLLIHHSRDLVNWAPLTFALPRPLTTVFAVDLVKHGGRYFIYIPFIPSPWAPEFGSAPRIFVISADRIEGPWSDPVDLGITGAVVRPAGRPCARASVDLLRAGPRRGDPPAVHGRRAVPGREGI